MTSQTNTAAPSAKESEMMVLGCMLSNSNALHIAIKTLNHLDFYYTEHKIIFQALNTIYQSHKLADVHLICEELRRQKQLKSVGDVAYITYLVQYAGTSTYVEEYIDELVASSQLRQLLDLGINLEKNALANKKPSQLVIDTLDQLKQIERRKSPKEKFSLQFLNERVENYLTNVPPSKPMLLEYADVNGNPIGFLPKSVVAMLVGAGGVGKTHLLTQLALSIATGSPWLNSITPTEHCGSEKQGHIFLGLGENQYDDIHRLLFKASKSFRKSKEVNIDSALKGASEHICAFSFCGQQAAFLEHGKPSRYFRELKMRLEDKAPKDGWSLIILDPVSRLLGTDAENDNAAATQFIALLEELIIDLPGNPTVLFAHHMSKAGMQNALENNKTDQTAARGSSALTDGVRWQLNARRGKNANEMVLSMTKSNFTAFSPDIHLKKDNEGFVERYFPEIGALPEENISTRYKCSKKTIKESHSDRILQGKP